MALFGSANLTKKFLVALGAIFCTIYIISDERLPAGQILATVKADGVDQQQQQNERYLIFLNRSSFSSNYKTAIDWLGDQIENQAHEEPEFIMDFLKQLNDELRPTDPSKASTSSNVRSNSLASSSFDGLESGQSHKLKDLLQGLILLERSETSVDCSGTNMRIFLLMIDQLYNHDYGIFREALVDSDCHSPYAVRRCANQRFLTFAKHYGGNHLRKCLERVPGRFHNGFVQSNIEFLHNFDQMFSDTNQVICTDDDEEDKNASSSDTYLANKLEKFSFTTSRFNGEHMLNIMESLELTRSNQNTKHQTDSTSKADRLINNLMKVCIELRNNTSDIFDIYNVAATLMPDLTKRVLDRTMERGQDHFRKANEYSRICAEAFNTKLYEIIYNNAKKNFKQQSGLMKLLAGCITRSKD